MSKKVETQYFVSSTKREGRGGRDTSRGQRIKLKRRGNKKKGKGEKDGNTEDHGAC
jgi:hypothetical protein